MGGLSERVSAKNRISCSKISSEISNLEFSSHLPKEGNTGLEVRSQTAKRLEKGVVGFQRHSGTKMTAEFENISLKRTK